MSNIYDYYTKPNADLWATFFQVRYTNVEHHSKERERPKTSDTWDLKMWKHELQKLKVIKQVQAQNSSK